MRSKEMTIWERIDSFYAAPFTKFMGNLVTALIIIILFVFENTVNCRLKAPPLSPSYKLPPPRYSPIFKNSHPIIRPRPLFRNNFLFEALQTKGIYNVIAFSQFSIENTTKLTAFMSPVF